MVIPEKLDPLKVPECEKLAKSNPDMATIRDFVEWVQEEKEFSFGKPHEHNEHCWEEHDCKEHSWDCDFAPCRKERTLICGGREGEFMSCHITLQKLLYEFFDINENKLEEERRALLDHQRELNARQEGKS